MGKFTLSYNLTIKYHQRGFPITQDLFQLALNITDPWFISNIDFNVESKRLDVYIDFKKGSTFSYEFYI